MKYPFRNHVRFLSLVVIILFRFANLKLFCLTAQIDQYSTSGSTNIIDIHDVSYLKDRRQLDSYYFNKYFFDPRYVDPNLSFGQIEAYEAKFTIRRIASISIKKDDSDQVNLKIEDFISEARKTSAAIGGNIVAYSSSTENGNPKELKSVRFEVYNQSISIHNEFYPAPFLTFNPAPTYPSIPNLINELHQCISKGAALGQYDYEHLYSVVNSRLYLKYRDPQKDAEEEVERVNKEIRRQHQKPNQTLEEYYEYKRIEDKIDKDDKDEDHGIYRHSVTKENIRK